MGSCTVHPLTLHCFFDSALAKLALGRAAKRGWQAGLLSVFPFDFLFFLIFSCEQCIDDFVPGNRTKQGIRARGTRVIARGRTGPARSGPVRCNFLFFYYFRKWLKTVLAPNKTKTMIWVQGWNGNSPYFSNYLIGVCQGVSRTHHPCSRLTPCSGGA